MHQIHDKFSTVALFCGLESLKQGCIKSKIVCGSAKCLRRDGSVTQRFTEKTQRTTEATFYIFLFQGSCVLQSHIRLFFQ